MRMRRKRKRTLAGSAGALLLLGLAAGASAQTCAKLEFAELDAMRREELLAMRCQYAREMNNPAYYAARGPGLTIANRCAQEATRMDRILARKYAVKATDQDAAQREISALCPK